MRWYWLYVAASFITAVAFTFALFLAMRERKLAADERDAIASLPEGPDQGN
jgi:hypothetical protein